MGARTMAATAERTAPTPARRPQIMPTRRLQINRTAVRAHEVQDDEGEHDDKGGPGGAWNPQPPFQGKSGMPRPRYGSMNTGS